MGRTSAPPVNGGFLREARIRKLMSLADVQRECAERGLDLGADNLSKIERGVVKWPAMRKLPVLAEVLGIDVEDMFAPGVAA